MGLTSPEQQQIPNVQKAAKEFFEPLLANVGLSEEQILTQPLEELQQSLVRINDAIQHAESFGTVKLNFGSTGVFVVSQEKNQIEIGILPLLLERKKQILDRIRSLKSQEKVESLRGLVSKIPDEAVRAKLIEEIEQFDKETAQLQEEESGIDEAKEAEETRLKIELARLQTELFERRSKVWLSFIEKESIATIVGSLILIIFAIALIVAMFNKIETTDIITNAFLVVLGYFFGQTVTRNKNDENT